MRGLIPHSLAVFASIFCLERKFIQEQKQKQLQQQQQEAEERRRREQDIQVKPEIISESLTNGDVTRRHRRQRQNQSKRTSAPEAAVPLVVVNGDATTHPPDNRESGVDSRLDKTPVVSPAVTEQTENKVPSESSSDVMTTNQRLLMDMLYSNQAVASKQTESDECSDETASVENETSDTSVNVKAMAEKLKASSTGFGDRLKPPAEAEQSSLPLTPEPPPVVVKKDSDIMWEKLMEQSFRVSDFDFQPLYLFCQYE